MSAQWTLVLLLVGLIAGYARRISGEADRQHILALDRLGRLADANALLYSLHRVTQTLPASLDLDDVLDTTVTRLRGLFDFDSAVVLCFDDTDGHWEVLRREGGAACPSVWSSTDLPPRRCGGRWPNGSVLSVPEPHRRRVVRAWPAFQRPGIYAVLPARGSVIGLLAIEHQTSSHFTDRDVELLRGFVEPVALAIDNARWFARLRTVGADEERTRIARDLHDRIGQSLAYLAFELDRIVDQAEPTASPSAGSLAPAPRRRPRRHPRGPRHPLRPAHRRLRQPATWPTPLEAFVARVRERSHARASSSTATASARLPLLQEREMWRIAQEALTNVERHSEATAGPGGVALQRRVAPRSRSPTTAWASPRARPAGSTPTASWACGSGPRASAPPSRSPASRARAPGCAAASCAPRSRRRPSGSRRLGLGRP